MNRLLLSHIKKGPSLCLGTILLFPKQPDYQRSTLPDSLPLIQ